jgi:hypothetical protein
MIWRYHSEADRRRCALSFAVRVQVGMTDVGPRSAMVLAARVFVCRVNREGPLGDAQSKVLARLRRSAAGTSSGLLTGRVTRDGSASLGRYCRIQRES